MAKSEIFHRPVLLEKVLEFLITDLEGTYIDCTIGGGGHAKGILENTKGRLIGIDRDEGALVYSQRALGDYSSRLTLLRLSFGQLEELPGRVEEKKFQGFLFDLGISWYQIETPQRGFSYLVDGPLDMRMDREEGLTAEEVVNEYPQARLALLLTRYGEEPRAKRIARRIAQVRKRGRITSTLQLASIISPLFPSYARMRGLSRSFQAIRIEVNDELEQLKRGLRGAWGLLSVGGRICVISYHSLEDRIVKETFRALPGGKVLTKKVVRPSPEEVRGNPRARGAKLRAVEKVGGL